jgi:hypothetical protein
MINDDSDKTCKNNICQPSTNLPYLSEEEERGHYMASGQRGSKISEFPKNILSTVAPQVG